MLWCGRHNNYATREAIDVVMRIKSKVPTRLVTLDRDLKVLTKNEIWEILKWKKLQVGD